MTKTIVKENTIFTIKELNKKWKISTVKGLIEITYDISKVEYPTFDELKEYILSEEIFQ